MCASVAMWLYLRRGWYDLGTSLVKLFTLPLRLPFPRSTAAESRMLKGFL